MRLRIGSPFFSPLAVASLAAPLLAAPAAWAAEDAAGGFRLLSVSTLVGEIITFAILVWVMMRFVWPPLMGAIEERRRKIADGLAAAEQGKSELAAAEDRREELMKDARTRASGFIHEGERRRDAIMAEAKREAESEKGRILEDGRRQIEQERVAAAREMRTRLGGLIVEGAGRVLAREIDEKAHADLLESLRQKL